MDQRRIEYLPLDDIKPATRNPKKHDGEGINRSIARFGVAELPLIDERTGRLVAGHGRVDQLAAMREAGQQPPGGVTVAEDGAWLVPVIRGWGSRSDQDAEAYLVASNSLTIFGGWDDAELAALLGDLAAFDPALLEVTGFSQGDLEELLADAGSAGVPPVALTDPDDVPEPPAEPITQPGDVWLLGQHRVVCGDSTEVKWAELALAGERADCMWTDPPYGVDYVGGNHSKTHAERRAAGGMSIQNDGAADLPKLLAGAFAVASGALKPGAPVYIAHPQGPLAQEFVAAILDAGWVLRQNLIWVKDSLVLSRSDYHYRHEPLLYGFTAGGEGRLGRGGERWYGDDAQTSVFEVPRPKRNDMHPTMKPVELIVRMLTNSCPTRGLVYEPFGGSGSTLIAAHRLGMRAAVIELDPKFVDVIARRFQEHTGTMPILEATGEPVDFTGQA